jgi:hypothetical protein
LPPTHKLTNPANILRWKKLKTLVTALKTNGHIRTDSVIIEKAGVNKGNFSAGLSGKRPISNETWDRFLAAYSEKLRPILESEDYNNIKVEEEDLHPVSTVKEPIAQKNKLESIELRLSSSGRNLITLAEQHKQDMAFLKHQLLDMIKSINTLGLEIKEIKRKLKIPDPPTPRKKTKKSSN